MSPALAPLAALFFSAGAEAAAWQLHPAEAGRGAVLTYAEGEPVSYRFECAADAVIVTETGVTRLMDTATGNPVADDWGGPLPPGAAVMALFAGKGDPQFVAAEAKRNPGGGWDLTIRLPKADKSLRAVGKSEMMSLFTTGYTIAVPLGSADRARWNGFIEGCRRGPAG